MRDSLTHWLMLFKFSRKKAQQVLSIGRTLSGSLWVSGDAILFTMASCFRFCTGCLHVIWVCGGCRSLFCFGLWAINFATSCTFEIYWYTFTLFTYTVLLRKEGRLWPDCSACSSEWCFRLKNQSDWVSPNGMLEHISHRHSWLYRGVTIRYSQWLSNTN